MNRSGVSAIAMALRGFQAAIAVLLGEVAVMGSKECPSDAPCFWWYEGPHSLDDFEEWTKATYGAMLAYSGMLACPWDTANKCCTQDGVPEAPFALPPNQGFAVCHRN